MSNQQGKHGDIMRFKLKHAACIAAADNNTAPVRLFCFPFAGGGASAFREWSKWLPDHIQVCAVQPPGRENRIMETPLDDVHELVTHLMPAMLPFFDKPFVFYGHSTGALVAFEFYRWLREKGEPLPEHMIVSASRAPHIPEPSPLHHLPETEFVEELKRFSGTPDIVLQNEELMEIFIPILRADLAIEETYVFEGKDPLDIPLSAFCGTMDKEAPHQVMAEWKKHTSNTFSLHEVKGGHFFIKSEMSFFLEALSGILNSIHPDRKAVAKTVGRSF